MIVGYARVSTQNQKREGNSLDDQEHLIHATYPNIEIRSEAYSGAKTRPIFEKLLNELSKDDMLVVTKLDRFCRATKEGLEYVDMLTQKGVKIHILNMGLIDNTPMGRLIVTNLLAFAEFERAMILERTNAGKEIARQREGYKEGRPSIEVDTKKIAEKRKRGESVNSICKELGISRRTYYYKMGGINQLA